MSSTAACAEQAFSQESGELFIETICVVRLAATSPVPPYPAGTTDGALREPATERSAPGPAIFPTDRAA